MSAPVRFLALLAVGWIGLRAATLGILPGFTDWGGMQPGLYRLDAGPRVSFRVRDNIHAHLDWRQRLVGNAHPASGPALTLAADF